MKDIGRRSFVAMLAVATGWVCGCVSSSGSDGEREIASLFVDPRQSSVLLNGRITGHFVAKSNYGGTGPAGYPETWAPPVRMARELHLGPCHFEVVDWDGRKVTGHHAMVGYPGVPSGVFYVDVPADGAQLLYGYYHELSNMLSLVPLDYHMDHWSLLSRVDDEPPPRPEDYWCLAVACCDGTLSPTCTMGGPLTGCCSHHGGVCPPAAP